MKPTNNYGLSDSLIDAVRKAVEEAKLHPNQQKLDVHEPEKDELTSQDFKKLRSGKKVKDGIDTKPKLKEEEQIDELSRGTLKSYVKKANKSAQHYSFEPTVRDPESGNQYRPTYTKRSKGIDLAKDKLKKEEVEQIDEAAHVKTNKYSWGTMKTVHQGSSFSIPLHPEHHEAIAKLKDQQEHKFKDETGRHWTAKRQGDDVHFQGANDGNSTKVPHKAIAESKEYEQMDEANSDNPEFEGRLAAIDMHHYKEADNHRKTLRTLGAQGKLNTPEGKFHRAALEKHQAALNAMAADDLNKILKKSKQSMRSNLKREEVEQMDEVKLADLPRRMVKGKSYGADYVDPEGADETAADMKKAEPKRKSGPQGTMKRRFNTKSYTKLRSQYK
jgi:hypothetical protein